MHEPTPSGFDQPGLADLFKVQYEGPSAEPGPTPSPRPSGPRPNHHTAIIVGCSVGGIACITLIAGLGFCYRREIRHRIVGSESPLQEMENRERVFQEMDNQETFAQEMDVPEGVAQEMGAEITYWELPAENKPVEMWSSTESPSSGRFRRSWVPGDEKVPQTPCRGESSEGSPGGSQRKFKMLPPLPTP